MEKKYSVKILTENLSDVLPCADIFLAGMPTSTAYWSILCEVPLILINPFKFKHQKKYEGINGIEFVNDINDLSESVTKIIYEDLKK